MSIMLVLVMIQIVCHGKVICKWQLVINCRQSSFIRPILATQIQISFIQYFSHTAVNPSCCKEPKPIQSKFTKPVGKFRNRLKLEDWGRLDFSYSRWTLEFWSCLPIAAKFNSDNIELYMFERKFSSNLKPSSNLVKVNTGH